MAKDQNKEYDPVVPDEKFVDDKEPGKNLPQGTENQHEEAFRSTPGEELRPKDGTLDPSSAR